MAHAICTQANAGEGKVDDAARSLEAARAFQLLHDPWERREASPDWSVWLMARRLVPATADRPDRP